MAHITINQYLQQVSFAPDVMWPSGSTVLTCGPTCRFTRPSTTTRVRSAQSCSRSNTRTWPTLDSRWGSAHSGSPVEPSVAAMRPHLRVFVFQLPSPEEKCQQVLEPPYDEMVAAHLRCSLLLVPFWIGFSFVALDALNVRPRCRCIYAVSNHDFVEAYKFQTLVVQYPSWWKHT